MSLPDALEAAASALPAQADGIRPANGDPVRLLEELTPEAALEVLVWLFANRPEDGEELALEWEDQETGATLLAGLDEEALPKSGRKVLRKVKHRLRSRGVAVLEAAPPPKVAALGSVDEELRGAWLTPLDPSGARMAVLVEPNPARGARLFETILDDERGILSFEVYTASRGKVRSFLKKLTGGGPQSAIEVEDGALQAVVARALAVQPVDRTLPRGFGEWRSRLSAAPEGAKTPGAHVQEALGEGGDGADLEAAVELVEKGRIGPWPASREVLTQLLERMRTALEGTVIVSGATKREQLDELYAEGAREIYEGAGAERAAHRLRESAYLFWKRGDEPAARACLAAAAAFDAGDAGSNPVALAMLRLPLGPAIAQLDAGVQGETDPDGDAGEESDSLIVTP